MPSCLNSKSEELEELSQKHSTTARRLIYYATNNKLFNLPMESNLSANQRNHLSKTLKRRSKSSNFHIQTISEYRRQVSSIRDTTEHAHGYEPHLLIRTKHDDSEDTLAPQRANSFGAHLIRKAQAKRTTSLHVLRGWYNRATIENTFSPGTPTDGVDDDWGRSGVSLSRTRGWKMKAGLGRAGPGGKGIDATSIFSSDNAVLLGPDCGEAKVGTEPKGLVSGWSWPTLLPTEARPKTASGEA